MACGKTPYATRKIARAAKKLLNKVEKGLMKKLTDEYYCYECSNWHLTSQGKQSSRDYKRHLNKTM